jgi:hypothetical protein
MFSSARENPSGGIVQPLVSKGKEKRMLKRLNSFLLIVMLVFAGVAFLGNTQVRAASAPCDVERTFQSGTDTLTLQFDPNTCALQHVLFNGQAALAFTIYVCDGNPNDGFACYPGNAGPGGVGEPGCPFYGSLGLLNGGGGYLPNTSCANPPLCDCDPNTRLPRCCSGC